MFTATRPRLLVIDDDRSILTLIGTVALAEGFDVVTTVDGREALAHLRVLQHLRELPIELRDQSGRRAGRRDHALPH